MPRYYFDVQDSGAVRDETGTDCADMAEVRKAAMRHLPDITREEVPDGDRRIFSLIVRDEQRTAVFVVTLSIVGFPLNQSER